MKIGLIALASGTLLLSCGGAKQSCNTNCSQAGSTHCSGTQMQTGQACANVSLTLSVPPSCPAGQSCLASMNSCQAEVCNGVPGTGTCGTWATRAPMPTAREHLGVIALGGKIYCIGGDLRINGNSGTNKGEVYDPATDVWTTKANPPYQIIDRFKTAAPGNDRIYLFRDDWTLEYDPIGDSWITTKALMPTPRQDFAVASAGGRVYVIGGSTAPYTNGASLQVVEAYDPSADSWSSKPQIPTVVQLTAAVTINAVIYVIASHSLLAFDTSTNVWSTKVASPVGSGTDLAAVAVGTRAYFWDNLNGTQFYGYDPSTNAFRVLSTRPSTRFWSGSDTVNGKIYVIGGETNPGTQTAAVSAVVDQFTP